MAGLLESVDPEGLLEFSVVYTDRSVNHMSARFQKTMCDIHSVLTDVYNAHRAVVIPGSGTSGMEAVARQFCLNQKCLVIRNGWFSYRWTQIFDQGQIPSDHKVLLARQANDEPQSAFAPVPIDEVIATIEAYQPQVVCAPHVETSAGMLLPDDYLEAIAKAVHEYGGLLVLDCIASGTEWIDMQAVGVDVLVSAPQKGWSGSPCAGLVMLSQHAYSLMQQCESNSFVLDLKKWSQIMEAYLEGKHAYHATMPTDGLIIFNNIMQELAQRGFATLKQQQRELGSRTRRVLEDAGFVSVAADGFQAPGVAVYYTSDDAIQSGRAFADVGLQIAAGVPLQVNEREDYKSFRIGLFGVDKLDDIDASVKRFSEGLSRVLASRAAAVA